MSTEFFGMRLRQLRERKQLSLRELARRSGISAATISLTENGQRWHNRLPPYDDLQAYARGLGVSVDELIGTGVEGEEAREHGGHQQRPSRNNDEMQRLAQIGREVMHVVERHRPAGMSRIRVAEQKVPYGIAIRLINAIAASELMEHGRQAEDTIMVPPEFLKGAREPIAFFVVGDCLALRGIVSGDHLIVDAANRQPRDGQIVAARVNGEETTKVFYRIDEQMVELRPTLADYPTITVTDDDEFEIIGVFVNILPTGRRD